MLVTLWQISKRLLMVTLLCGAVSTNCFAAKLDDVVRDTVACNPEILMASAEKYARANAVREKTAGYLPKIDIFASYGRDYNKNYFTRLENPGPAGDGKLTLTKQEAYFTVRQMLFDGFAVRSQVEANTAKDNSSAYNLLAKLDDVILQISAAYIDIIMLRVIHGYAKENVTFHQRIVDDIVNNRVPNIIKGDLDFAKSRLTVAQTIVLDLQRDINDAQANYIKVVGKNPGNMYSPEAPEKNIPTSEEAVVAVTLKNNPLVFVSQAEIQAARADKRGAKAAYFPTLDLELSGSSNKNVDGINQNTNSLSAMLLLKYNLFQGGKDIANERKTAWILEEKKESLNETIRLLEQQARHVWNALVNYRGQLSYLKHRVDALQHTHLAYYKEFTNGKRDLFELLRTEMEFFDARASYATAQHKEVFSRFMVLQSIGKIRQHFNVRPPAAVATVSGCFMNGY